MRDIGIILSQSFRHHQTVDVPFEKIIQNDENDPLILVGGSDGPHELIRVGEHANVKLFEIDAVAAKVEACLIAEVNIVVQDEFFLHDFLLFFYSIRV